MPKGSFFRGPLKFDTGGPRGSEATKLAVESFQNIANSSVVARSLGVEGDAADEELKTIGVLLGGEAGAQPIAAIARRLGWDASKTADALERGGRIGLFRFFKKGETTFVELF